MRIFASGNLDEYHLRDLMDAGAPIDGFGVGTRMNTSADAPFLDCAYKLTEYAGVPRRKRSEGKATWPGCKQVFRRLAPGGQPVGDLLTLQGDEQDGTALLQPVMIAGRRTAGAPTLQASRDFARRQLAALPESLRALEHTTTYAVEVSARLRAMAHQVDQRTLEAAGAAAPGRV